MFREPLQLLQDLYRQSQNPSSLTESHAATKQNKRADVSIDYSLTDLFKRPKPNKLSKTVLHIWMSENVIWLAAVIFCLTKSLHCYNYCQ